MSWFKSFLNNILNTIGGLFHPRREKIASDSVSSKRSFDEQSGMNNGVVGANVGIPYGPNDKPEDLYSSYNNTGMGVLDSVLNKYGEAGITGQQAALNEMSLDNQRRQYAFQTQGMLEAGLNPALMYESGAMSAPSAPSPTQGMSMSELLQVIFAKKQSELMDAQIRNTDADTDKKKGETEQINLINKYYPQATESSIDKTLSEIGLNNEQIRKVRGEVDLQELDKELKRLDKTIKEAEANESSAYFKAVREYQEASTGKAKAEKAELVVRAAMETIEKDYMKETNTKMGTANILAIASFLGTIGSSLGGEIGDGLPGLFDTEGFKSDMKGIWKKFKDWLYESGNFGSW